MYRRSCFIHTMAAIFMIAGMAGSASAAQISQVTWDVTGGSIDGFWFGGDITGGSVVWTAPTASGISTPNTFFGGTGTLQIDLYTDYNTLRAVGISVTGLTVSPGAFFASFSLGSGSALTSVTASMSDFFGFLRYVAASGYGTGSGTTYSTGYLYAMFTLGNEVRTVVPGGNGGPPVGAVPEPSAALAFGVGFTLIALRSYSRKSILTETDEDQQSAA